MKIAVASQDSLTISPHPGQCRHFLLFTVREGKVVERHSLHIAHEETFNHSDPRRPHPLAGVQVLIAGGLGQGLLHRLEAMHIQGVATPEGNPERAVQLYLGGSLPQRPPVPGSPDHPADDHAPASAPSRCKGRSRPR